MTLWPDMDDIDEQGHRSGLDAAVAFAQSRKLSGRRIEVMGVDVGKDAADAAREAPLSEIDQNELKSFAGDLENEGLDKFRGTTIRLDGFEISRS